MPSAHNPTRADIHIGTSGWSYDHWKRPFYPPDLPAAQMLDHYGRRLSCVEINNSFYHLPERQTLEHWRDTVPEGFVFSVKASRYITHMKKLKEPTAGLAALLERVGVLGDRLGPILFQLPPRWRFNAERLEAFLQLLSDEFRYAFEFRDPSWINEQTYELLARHKAAFCIYELDGFLSPQVVTTDMAYVRLHGPEGPYQGNYDAKALSGWAGKFATWARQGLDIHCYFDNDQAGFAVQNALQLQSLLHGTG